MTIARKRNNVCANNADRNAYRSRICFEMCLHGQTRNEGHRCQDQETGLVIGIGVTACLPYTMMV